MTPVPPNSLTKANDHGEMGTEHAPSFPESASLDGVLVTLAAVAMTTSACSSDGDLTGGREQRHAVEHDQRRGREEPDAVER